MPSLVEIDEVVLEKISQFRQCNLLFPYFLPMEKGGVLHFNKREYTSSKDDFCKVWLKNENVKSLHKDPRTDGQTDDRQQAIGKAHLSFNDQLR